MIISRKKAYMFPVLVGAVLILIGLFLRIPGGALTTYGSLDGESAGSYYVFDKKYSAIDEYVGGDAYNYIIGASLVAGKTAGMIAAKAITMVGGAICVCFGVTLMLSQEKAPDQTEASRTLEATEMPNVSETVQTYRTVEAEEKTAVNGQGISENAPEGTEK